MDNQEEQSSAGLLFRIQHQPKIYLIAEFLILFWVLPICAYIFRHSLRHLVIPALVVLGSFCLITLVNDRTFNRSKLWNSGNIRRHLRDMLFIFVPLSLITTVVFWIIQPEIFLSLPMNKTKMWLALMVIYPILSVYPQEIIFRAFFFHRYSSIFKSTMAMILASSLCFGIAHLFFGNWVAPVCTFFASFLFSYTYAKTSSTLLVSLEHALWGNFAFTVGIGWYFYSGAIGKTIGG